MNPNNNPNGYDNQNDFYAGNQQSPPQWGAQPPMQPYYADNRTRVQENTSRSVVVPVLVGIVVVLLIALCLIGGYLLGNSRKKDGLSDGQLTAALQTTISATEPDVTESPTEAAAAATETSAETTAETTTETTTTTVATSVVVSVKVVTEAPKTIFVGSYICDMRVATKSTDLNMRAEPSTSASIIGSIPKDTIVGYYGAEGSWGIVYYGGKYGYVNTAYLSGDLYPSQNKVYYSPSVSYATINASSGLNLRAGESTSADIITTIPYGKEVTVYSSYDGWSYVSYGNNYGYVKSEYLKFK